MGEYAKSLRWVGNVNRYTNDCPGGVQVHLDGPRRYLGSDFMVWGAGTGTACVGIPHVASVQPVCTEVHGTSEHTAVSSS